MAIKDGSKTVTTSGTREKLVASVTLVNWAIIQPKAANGGAIYVGGPTVSATSGSILNTGDSYMLARKNGFYDLSEIWIDAANSGEGVQFTYDETVYY